jgi:hypothetical protein
MERRFQFGPWAPDVSPALNQGGLTVCKNVLPINSGYSPIPSLATIDAFALPEAPKEIVTGRNPSGTTFFYVAADGGIYKWDETAWLDVSRTTSAYSVLSEDRWAGTQFGDHVLFTNKADRLQAINWRTETTFSDVVDAPRAARIAASDNFLWLGNLSGPSEFDTDASVGWSGLYAPTYWPDPLSDDATQALSGRQILEGNGGEVTGIVAGSEVTAIFQQDAIHRADFVGNDLVWRFTRLEVGNGMLVREAAVAFERRVLFLGQDGWRVFDYTATQNIGKETINRFFLNDWDPDYPESLRMRKDPRETRIYISYAATDATGGVPNRILIWDYALDQWTIVEPGAHYLLHISGLVPPSLDSPDLPPDDPDQIGGDPVETDPPGDESFDDVAFGYRTIELGAFDGTFTRTQFSGTPLVGVLETGDLELAPGRRSLLHSVRPSVDGEDCTVSVAAIPRRGDDTPAHPVYGTPSAMEADGDCSVRVDGRYHRLRFTLGTDSTNATHYDCRFQPTGVR